MQKVFRQLLLLHALKLHTIEIEETVKSCLYSSHVLFLSIFSNLPPQLIHFESQQAGSAS